MFGIMSCLRRLNVPNELLLNGCAFGNTIGLLRNHLSRARLPLSDDAAQKWFTWTSILTTLRGSDTPTYYSKELSGTAAKVLESVCKMSDKSEDDIISRISARMKEKPEDIKDLLKTMTTHGFLAYEPPIHIPPDNKGHLRYSIADIALRIWQEAGNVRESSEARRISEVAGKILEPIIR